MTEHVKAESLRALAQAGFSVVSSIGLCKAVHEQGSNNSYVSAAERAAMRARLLRILEASCRCLGVRKDMPPQVGNLSWQPSAG